MSDEINILVTQEETLKRIELCVSCEKNIFDVIPKCQECNCSISMLTTLNFKTCPIGKW